MIHVSMVARSRLICLVSLSLLTGCFTPTLKPIGLMRTPDAALVEVPTELVGQHVRIRPFSNDLDSKYCYTGKLVRVDDYALVIERPVAERTLQRAAPWWRYNTSTGQELIEDDFTIDRRDVASLHVLTPEEIEEIDYRQQFTRTQYGPW